MTDDALRKLALAATKGTWAVEDPCGPEILSIVADADRACYDWKHIAQIGVEPADEDDLLPAQAAANAAYIAAVSPDVVLGLLDRIKELERRARELERNLGIMP